MTLTVDSVSVARPAASEAEAVRGHLRALRSLSDALARPLDLVELFRATQRETARAVDAQAFLFGIYDEASQTVEVVRQF